MVLAVGILAALVYIIRARLTVDRIIGINLVGTIVVMVIVVLTFLLGEDYLADIALIYVVLSFIAVMMLCRIYINLYQRNQRKKEEASHDRGMDPLGRDRPVRGAALRPHRPVCLRGVDACSVVTPLRKRSDPLSRNCCTSGWRAIWT